MTTIAFDTTLLPVLVEEYADLPITLAREGTATIACAEPQWRGLPEALRAVMTPIALAEPPIGDGHLLQILQSVKPSRGNAPEHPDVALADDAFDARLAEVCLANGWLLVCGRRALAETAFKFGASVKNLREFLKAIGDPRHRWLDEDTGR